MQSNPVCCKYANSHIFFTADVLHLRDADINIASPASTGPTSHRKAGLETMLSAFRTYAALAPDASVRGTGTCDAHMRNSDTCAICIQLAQSGMDLSNKLGNKSGNKTL
jgi:hypothetical protein